MLDLRIYRREEAGMQTQDQIAGARTTLRVGGRIVLEGGQLYEEIEI